MYKKGAGIICRLDHMPHISQITSIYVIREKIVFKVLDFKTEYYDSHYRAYIITPTDTTVFVHIEQIIVPNPVHIRCLFRRKLFIMPYHIKTS